MHIAEINIENFRLFESMSLKLNAGLNVIVGENNAGKTALIDAIRITLDTNSAEWTKINEEDFFKTATSFHIRLKFENITPDQAHVFVEHLTHEKQEDGSRKSVLFLNLIANITDNIHRGARFIKTELRSGENAEGPIIERDIRKYLSATYLKPLRDAEAELSAGRGSRLMQILSSSKKWDEGTNLEALIKGFVEANQEAKGNAGIDHGKKSINDNFQALTFEDDKEKFNIAIQILGCKAYEDMSDSERKKALQDILERLSLILHEDLPLQGLGYNNVLFMATELILLEQERGGFPLLLIEEPEAHLHPQLQMKLLKFISEECNPPEDINKIQTILSTHSPNLASKADLESLILMKDGQAYPLRKELTQLANDDYEFLEKFLDVTKANLFFAKGVLIVEGDAESILLPTIAKLLGRPLENYGVSIVNVGSRAYMRYAKIYMRADENEDTGIKVSCIRDLDLWPEKADKEDFPNIGFKQVKDRNKKYWVSRQKAGVQIGKAPNKTRQALSRLGRKQVAVFVSEEWTLEYCLAKSPLAPFVYEALKGNNSDFNTLTGDDEERAIKLYGMIEKKSGAKTEVAYKLSRILEREFLGDGKKQDLKERLPPYIVDALEHVTGAWPANLDELPIPTPLPAPEENNVPPALPAEGAGNA